MIGGIVHQENGTIYFEQEAVATPADVPRRPGTSGTTWYATASVSMLKLIQLLSEGDEAFGPNPDRPIGVVFYWCGRDGKTKSLKVISSSVWGVRSFDPKDTENQIVAKMIMTAQGGIRPSSSAASSALSHYMRTYDGQGGRPFSAQLAPRWRGLAHGSLHGGPVVLTQAAADDIVHIDLRAAYLSAMRQPMPVYGRHPDTQARMGGYITHKGGQWRNIRDETGFIEATVWVPPERFGRGDVPPLPIRHFSGSSFPTGIVRGAWPIMMLRDAIDNDDVQILKLHQFAIAPVTMDLFSEISEDFLHNRQGKLLYTRFWGKWASRGGFVGQRTSEPSDGSVRSHGLWWEHEGIDLLDYKAPPTYRPDIAAMIAGYNHRQVMTAVRKLKKGSIVSLYVDAIWTTDVEGALEIVGDGTGDWVLKQRGPGRFWAPGVYHHGTHLAATGYDPAIYGDLTPEKLATWAASPLHNKLNLMTNRQWSAHPSRDPSAVSTPVQNSDAHCVPATRGPDVNDTCWTSNGWVRTELKEQIAKAQREDSAV